MPEAFLEPILEALLFLGQLIALFMFGLLQHLVETLYFASQTVLFELRLDQLVFDLDVVLHVLLHLLLLTLQLALVLVQQVRQLPDRLLRLLLLALELPRQLALHQAEFLQFSLLSPHDLL